MENDQLLVTMTKQELDDLIYFTALRASTRALDKHFRGLLPFLTKMNDDLETIIREQDYIKLSLQQQNRGDSG